MNGAASERERERALPDLLKVTVIESEEILVLIIKALDIVRNPLREVPDITGLKNIGCESTVLINAGE